MTEALPVVLVPGLLCTPQLYAEQIPALWRFGPVGVADHRRGDSMAAIASQILANAPPRFALAGLSMGGYIAFEMLRQAPGRILRLALLDTAARADTPEQSESRRAAIAQAQGGGFGEIADMLYPRLVAPSRHGDVPLRDIVRRMAEETGPEAFIRQQTAILNRPDSRPDLAAVACPTLVLVGEQDALTPPERATEMAGAIPRARLVVVPGSGHLSTLEAPDIVSAALTAWLSA